MENILDSDINSLPLTPVAEELSLEAKVAEARQRAEVADIASIPGWSRIKEQMKQDALNLRLHRDLEFGPNDSDEKVGKEVRSRLLMAQWIEKYIERIEGAVLAVEVMTKEAEDEQQS